MHFWSQIDEKFMTEEESDENDVTILYQHKPHWRSESNQLHYLVHNMMATYPFRFKQIYSKTRETRQAFKEEKAN